MSQNRLKIDCQVDTWKYEVEIAILLRNTSIMRGVKGKAALNIP